MRNVFLLSLALSLLITCVACRTEQPALANAESSAAPGPYAVETVKGPEAKKAYGQLAEYYSNGNKKPPYDEALARLANKDSSYIQRGRAGQYVLALLQQSLADETNGRADWRRLPFWGGGSNSPAREFRAELAEKFGDTASVAEAWPAAMWLVLHDTQAANIHHGAQALARIESPESERVYRHLLQQPHPNESVCVSVLEAVGERKLSDLAPEVKNLVTHYRDNVRREARRTALSLKLRDLPDYKPADAFTPALKGVMDTLSQMALAKPPKDARYVKATITTEVEGGEPWVQQMNCWVLNEDASTFQLLGPFGATQRVEKKQTELEPASLVEEAKALASLREAGGEDARERLSREGMLTAQFEPGFISVREALVAVSCYQQGDRENAARVLFPCLNSCPDDRWLVQAVRDGLGHQYHQQMLRSFSHQRDYATTLQLADHLSQAAFDGYGYQDRAKQLAGQLRKRHGDFKEFVLPAPGDWVKIKKEMSRQEQIEFLAARLRLLNCQQWSQPGGVDYAHPQFAEPGFHWISSLVEDEEGPQQVVNPYVALREMKLEVRDLPALVPFLADDNFMPTFSYWRNFHPSRTLHRVNWVVAELVDSAARRNLAQLKEFNELDEAGQKRHLADIIAWCRANADKTREELLLATLRTSKNWSEFEAAAREAAGLHNTAALAALVERIDDFPDRRDDISEFCYHYDLPEALPHARQWLKSPNESQRFWAALIALRHGDDGEGLRELTAVLREDDGSYFYPRAIEPLLANGSKPSVDLACGILAKERFELHDFETSTILHRLLLAGRQEAMDYLKAKLTSRVVSGSSFGQRDGKPVEREVFEADRAAKIVLRWHTGDWDYDTLAPPEEREMQRGRILQWLEKQFQHITNAEPTQDLRTKPDPFYHAQWQLDAP